MGLLARFLMPNRVGAAAAYKDKVLGYSPIAYWMLAEASGADAFCQVDAAQDGTHVGVTLGQPGIGDGETCPLYDGINDDTRIYTTTLRDAFPGAEGSLLAWAKVSGAGVWTDGSKDQVVRFYGGGGDTVAMLKNPTNNQLRLQYMAGSVYKTTLIPTSSVDWMTFGITWSAGADEVRWFYNGAQQGAPETGLGVWAGTLQLPYTRIGDSGVNDYWSGWLAHVAVFDTPLGQPAITDLATI